MGGSFSEGDRVEENEHVPLTARNLKAEFEDLLRETEKANRRDVRWFLLMCGLGAVAWLLFMAYLVWWW